MHWKAYLHIHLSKIKTSKYSLFICNYTYLSILFTLIVDCYFRDIKSISTQCCTTCQETVILTPPTLSKCSESCWKSMSWPLNAQEKLKSSAGSTDTWQGSTILSPTMISMLLGLWVILLGSKDQTDQAEPSDQLYTVHTTTVYSLHSPSTTIIHKEVWCFQNQR